MATANAVDNEATNVTSVHAASAVGGQHFIHSGAVLDVHFPGVYESHYWHTPLPVVGWYVATVVDGPDFRGAGMGVQHEWRFLVEFFDSALSDLEYHGERCLMELFVPSVPAAYANLFGGEDEEEEAAQPPTLPLPADLAQWIRPNGTPAIQEAVNHPPMEPCDLCGAPLTSSCHYALHTYPGIDTPPVCTAATCLNVACWFHDGHPPRAFHRSSFGAAPSHLPDRTLHPLRNFRRLLYRSTVQIGAHHEYAADPYEPCACNEGSRVAAIMQVVHARAAMQRELALLRVVTAKVNEHYTNTPSQSFVSGPAWAAEVWHLLICLAGMNTPDTAAGP